MTAPSQPSPPDRPDRPDRQRTVFDPELTATAQLLADLPATGADDDPPAAPPAALRTRLLQQIRAGAADAALPTRAQLPAPARAYRDQVDALDALLTGFTAQQWRLPVVNGWTADRVLGHLLAVDALAAAAIGVPTPPETGQGSDPTSRTASVHAALAGAEPAAWQRIWRAQAVALLRHAAAVGEGPLSRPVTYLGVTLSAADVLLDRGFETWVHGEDLRESAGRAPLRPDPQDVHRLADLGVRMLPRAWDGVAAAGRDGDLAVELTGDGGGAWTVAADGTVRAAGVPAPRVPGANVPAATLRLDVMEFCRLAGGRRALADAVHASEGPPSLVADALAAVAGLARL